MTIKGPKLYGVLMDSSKHCDVSGSPEVRIPNTESSKSHSDHKT